MEYRLTCVLEQNSTVARHTTKLLITVSKDEWTTVVCGKEVRDPYLEYELKTKDE